MTQTKEEALEDIVIYLLGGWVPYVHSQMWCKPKQTPIEMTTRQLEVLLPLLPQMVQPSPKLETLGKRTP